MTREKIKKWYDWYELPQEILIKFKQVPELVFLRHQGKWRVKSNKEIEFRTTLVGVDTTMGAIYSLLSQGWRVYIKPSATHLVVVFLEPKNNPEIQMWTREEIIGGR